MSDNIDVTPGVGKTVATDEVTIDGALVQVQRIKPTFGVAGSAVDVSASNPLPVVQTGTPALATGAATEATLSDVNTVLGVVTDGWDGITTNPTIHGAMQFAAERIGALATDVISNNTPATVAQDTTQLRNGGTALTVKYAAISTSASGDTTVVAAVTGKRIKVVDYVLTRASAVNMKWRSGMTDITGLLYNGAAPGFNPVGHFRTAVGELLAINLSAAVGVGGHITYVEE